MASINDGLFDCSLIAQDILIVEGRLTTDCREEKSSRKEKSISVRLRYFHIFTIYS